MKITDLNLTDNGKLTKISAKVVWEDCEREPQEVYFETEPEFSSSIRPNPHSFIIASILPALYFGERRLYIDGEVCPQLKEGLLTAQSLLHHWWYPHNHNLVNIEAKKLKSTNNNGEVKKAAFCFSGGIDSMATLYNNHSEYPETHPGYLRDGLLVFGLEVRDRNKFKSVLKSITNIALESNLTFVPVYTNIIQLGPENSIEFWENFWLNQYMSASFSAIAHALSNRWHRFSINSSHDIPNLIPHGSNPLLTGCYSSSDLAVNEAGISFSRFRKTEMISKWYVALQNLRVCNITESYQDGQLNCGQCEKCIRTMLALIACDALNDATCFPIRNLTPAIIDNAVELAHNTLPLYLELIDPLRASGHTELARAVEKKIQQYHRDQYKNHIKNVIYEPLKRLDQKYLNASLSRIKYGMKSLLN